MASVSGESAQVSSISEVLPSTGISLRKNFSWTLAGNIVYSGCQWGMLVILAKLGSPVMVGQFALGLAVTAPVIMFANLQLRAVQATDARQEYLFGDYLGLRLIAVALALMVIAAIAVFSGYRMETTLVIVAIGIAKVFESISDVFYGLLQHHERMDRIAKSMMIKGPLSLLALGTGVYLTGSTLWGTAGLAVTWMLILVLYDTRSGALVLGSAMQKTRVTFGAATKHSALSPRWEKKKLVKLTLLALPLGFVILLISLNVNIPRYFIEHYLGERQLGIFAAISYLMVAGTTIVNALGQSASPRLAKYYAVGGYKLFVTLLAKLVIIGSMLGLAGILIVFVAGREVLDLLYRPEYAKHVDIFLWLMVAAGINYIASFLGYGITAARYFKVQMPLFALVVIVLVVACFWLIPVYGLLGATIALVVAAIVQVLGSMVILVAMFRLHRGFEGSVKHEQE